MQAYFVGGSYHGRCANLQPRNYHGGPVRSGQVPATIYVNQQGSKEEYVLAHSTGHDNNLCDADLYYTPPGLSDIERNEAISNFVRTTAPWQSADLPPDTSLC